jgi:predicted O-methyltransferase YrrM
MRDDTGLLAVDTDLDLTHRTRGEALFTVAFGAIQWPWLARSLYGGGEARKQALLRRIGLPADALPRLGSWKADVALLEHIADAVETLMPRRVVELGAGATTMALAAALRRWAPEAILHSFDQNSEFLAATKVWLGQYGLASDFSHAPLVRRAGYPGLWYDLPPIDGPIDLLVIDGPPWSIHPFGRGTAEVLFDRVRIGGMVLLDDAARPGERIVARRWKRRFPNFSFRLESAGSKGMLTGVRLS